MFPDKKQKVVYLGSDHHGLDLKVDIRKYLESLDYLVTDLGAFNEEAVDYPDIAREVSEKVLEREGALGLLLCGSGIGMSMAANKVKGIRAVNARDVKMAEMARKHNNANVITFSADLLSFEEIKKMLDAFLNTDFEKVEERHVRRVKKIDML